MKSCWGTEPSAQPSVLLPKRNVVFDLSLHGKSRTLVLSNTRSFGLPFKPCCYDPTTVPCSLKHILCNHCKKGSPVSITTLSLWTCNRIMISIDIPLHPHFTIIMGNLGEDQQTLGNPDGVGTRIQEFPLPVQGCLICGPVCLVHHLFCFFP